MAVAALGWPNLESWSAVKMGRPTTRATVEQALRLDIDTMMRRGGIRVGGHLAGQIRLELYDDDIGAEFESRTGNPGGWRRLRSWVPDYETGKPLKVDDTLRLTTTEPANVGGRQFWFLCPRTGGRCRAVYLPLGARHFRSRRAYRLAYA